MSWLRSSRNNHFSCLPIFDLAKWIGKDAPSLVGGSGDAEVAEIDLPDYDTRHLIASRDPLCCVYAFDVMTRVVFPSLYGYRMCPDCPHCAESEDPCMDSFGSSATAMGGSAGRADAAIGAVEAQKAEDGTLHVHMFVYVQMFSQFATLKELSEALLSLIHI